MRKRGQAAMEFLMTYGWAILAAVIVIGVLAAFGVFSVGDSLPTLCVVNFPLNCDQNQIAATSGAAGVGFIQFILGNGVGNSIDVSAISLTGDCVGTGAAIAGFADGTVATVTVNCAALVSPGQVLKGDISVTYMPNGGTLSNTVTGSYSVTAP